MHQPAWRWRTRSRPTRNRDGPAAAFRRPREQSATTRSMRGSLVQWTTRSSRCVRRRRVAFLRTWRPSGQGDRARALDHHGAVLAELRAAGGHLDTGVTTRPPARYRARRDAAPLMRRHG
jgi:hypothetical protein